MRTPKNYILCIFNRLHGVCQEIWTQGKGQLKRTFRYLLLVRKCPLPKALCLSQFSAMQILAFSAFLFDCSNIVDAQPKTSVQQALGQFED